MMQMQMMQMMGMTGMQQPFGGSKKFVRKTKQDKKEEEGASQGENTEAEKPKEEKGKSE